MTFQTKVRLQDFENMKVSRYKKVESDFVAP